MANRPATRPGGPRVSSLPAGGRPGGGNQPGLVGRPGSPNRGGGLGAAAGIAAGAGAGAALGAGLANAGERPGLSERPRADGLPATLPGLDRGPNGGGRLANRDVRRDDLQNRLAGRNDVRGDRQDLRGDRQDNRTDRQGDRQDVRTDRQDNRTDRQDNRQDFREDRLDNLGDYAGDYHEDWQDWNDNHDWAYHDWHHGYWHGHGDGWWDHMWDEHPVAATLGLTTWGINRAAYGFGLWGYTNPYYVEPYTVGTTVIDYSQPLVISEPYPVEVPVEVPVETTPSGTAAAAAPAEPLPPGVTQAGLDAFEQARQAFYGGDYQQALTAIDQATAEMPKDTTTHEFRGLVLFALGRYREAAAPVHAVLAVGPGWDWTTLVGLYPSVDVYTTQVRALEKHVREQADAPSLFLLAYHYITMGHTDAAVARLRDVTARQPDDTVAANLLAMLAPPDEQPATTAPTQPSPSDAVAVAAADLKGDWTAKGPGGANYKVAFAEDGSFVWTYAAGGKTEKISGVYAVDGDVLAMEPDSGGTLAATISKPTAKGFQFVAAGTPRGKPGLDFVRAAAGS